MIASASSVFESRQEAFLADLFSFLRFPSISTAPEHKPDMLACAEWIVRQLAASGLHAKIMSTGGHPAVFADSGPPEANRAAPTILCYGHYDVQPIGEQVLWESPPFEPTIRDGAIYARGSADNKGQLMTHLAAVRCWKEAAGQLPIRVKFLIEGEEEIGSPNLPAFLRENRDLLACDDVLISDTFKHDADTPAIPYATRGLLYKQLTVDGPTRDLHSGQYGGMVANPANVLADLIASLHDNQRRVTVPGFYDDVTPLTATERHQLNQHGLSETNLLAQTGSPTPLGEEGYTATERGTARPTLDVNGLTAGFSGPGSATLIPARASAKVSMRLVANQNPDKISRAFDEALRRICPPAVRLSITTSAACPAYLRRLDSPILQVAIASLASTFGREPILTREGGTLPILPLFKEILGADSLMLGFAVPDCNLHSPNEFFHITDFHMGTRCIIQLMGALGAGG
ncbi:MAG: dipeptidase [Phycisphaerales bacterium]|nr:dipeptidase [Phycisphaerales bacterium]